jgi:hypothetical protein
MRNKSSSTIKRKPKSKILLNELLEDYSVVDLAKVMNVVYTQLYPYKKPGANPTLLILEQLAEGLSRLHGKPISPLDLIEVPIKAIKVHKKSRA